MSGPKFWSCSLPAMGDIWKVASTTVRSMRRHTIWPALAHGFSLRQGTCHQIIVAHRHVTTAAKQQSWFACASAAPINTNGASTTTEAKGGGRVFDSYKARDNIIMQCDHLSHKGRPRFELFWERQGTRIELFDNKARGSVIMQT